MPLNAQFIIFSTPDSFFGDNSDPNGNFGVSITNPMTIFTCSALLAAALASSLTQWTSPQTLEAGAMAGAMFETWAYGQVLRSHAHAGSTSPMYFFRDKDQREIDLLIASDGLLYPIEIKKSAAPGRDAIAAMLMLAGHGVALGPGAVVCMVPDLVPLSGEPRITAVPAWLL